MFCGTCEFIQPLDGTVNYFSLLGVAQSFSIDVDDLDDRFKRLQREVHPDLFGTRSKQEQTLSNSASSSVNIAYRVLRNPSTRAQYLLQLHGVDAIGETAGSGGKFVDAALLGEIMDAREAIEDPTTSSESLGEMSRRTTSAIDDCMAHIAASFEAGNVAGAAKATVALQYYTKLRVEIDERLERDKLAHVHRPGS